MNYKRTIKSVLSLVLCLVLCFSVFLVSENTDSSPMKALAAATTTMSYGSIEGAAVPKGVESITTSTLDATTNCCYPWSTYNGDSTVFCSGNKNVQDSVSVLKVTVKGSGALVYNYKVFSTDTTLETVPDSLLVSVDTEVTKSLSYSKAVKAGAERFYSALETQDYTRKVIKVTADDDEYTDIFFTYKKNGSVDGSMDIALISGIEFNTGTAEITASVSDNSLGTVSGGGTYYAGDEVTLTATPNDGSTFYGWSVDGKLVADATSTSYTFYAGNDVAIKAQLGTSATVVQNRTTGELYTDLAKALSEAKKDQTVEIVNNGELSGNAEIKEGVTLYVPYDDSHDADGNTDGTTADSSSAFATEAKTYRRLTVAENATLTVNGELLIGGTISYPSQLYSGHTSGVHGRITNNGTISVTGGTINCYGFIDGNGSVVADTGKVYEPFVVFDYAGGSNTLSLYEAGQNPFMQYTMQNISCALTVRDTAAYGVYCNLYASGDFNKTSTLLIGGAETAPIAMIMLSDGAELTRTVDKTKSISGGTVLSGTYGADIYKTIYTVNGGASLNNMIMKIYGVTINVQQYPIPYCFSFVLTNGDYTLPDGWTLMPGAEMTVAENASLTSKGNLYVLDGLINTGMSGRYYPSSEKLASSGFATCGVLTVDGILNLESSSSFGGIVQTNGTGKVVIDDSVTLANTVQVGATAHYDDNTCISELNAKAYINGTLTDLAEATTYCATSGDAWTLDSYTVSSYSKTLQTTVPTTGTYKQTADKAHYAVYAGPETVAVNQAMNGEFGVTETIDAVTTVNKTYYDADDSSRTIVENIVTSGSKLTFTVSRTVAGKGYNYIVEASVNDGEPVTLTADETGTYTLTNVKGTAKIVVTSVLRGDVNLNGKIAANDVTLLSRYISQYAQFDNDFNSIAADIKEDGKINTSDLTKLRRYLAGYTSEI